MRTVALACVVAVTCGSQSVSGAEISGVLLDAAGKPIPDRVMHFYHGPKKSLLSVKTDAKGLFSTGNELSEQCHLVVAEEAEGGPMSRVVFLARDIRLGEDERRTMDFRVVPQHATNDHEEALRLLGCDWPVQLVRARYELEQPRKRPKFVKELHGARVQVGDIVRDEAGRVTAYSAYCRLGVRATDDRLEWAAESKAKKPWVRKSSRGLEVGNDRLAVVLPSGKDPDAPPIAAVRGVDGQWFGRGEWRGAAWDSCQVEELDRGRAMIRYRLTYARGGARYTLTVTLGAGDDCFRIDERASPGLEGGWGVCLSEGYAPDRHREYRYYGAYHHEKLPKGPAVLASIQPWTFCGIMDFRETVSVYQADGRSDAVALFSIDGTEWTTTNDEPFYNYADFSSRNGWRMPADTTATRLVSDKDGKLSIEYPLQEGTRITGWAVYDKDYDRTRYKAIDARHVMSDTPLSKVLTMKLAWDQPIEAPRLHGGIDDWKKVSTAKLWGMTTYGYPSGSREEIPSLRAAVLGKARGLVNYFRYPDSFDPEKPATGTAGYVGRGQRSIEIGPQARLFAEAADLAFAMGVLSGEEKSLVRASLAFMAYTLADPELYAGMNALGNFKVDGYFGLMLLARVLREHPDFGRFWDHYLRQVKQDVEEGVYLYEDGGTNECPIYVLMAMNFLTKQAWYLRRWGEKYDLASQPRFQQALEMMAEWTTPPLPKISDATARVLPLIGDTTTQGRDQWGLFGTAVKVYEKTDPEFAGKMLWFWNLMGKPLFFGHGINCTSGVNWMCTVPKGGRLANSLLDCALKPIAPARYGSRAIEGFGVMMRKNWNTPEEFMLLVKAGRSSGHDHPDDGAFILFAGGKCISTGYGKYPYMTSSWRYNLVRFDGRSNWSRGEVTGFLNSELCDAATTHIPVVNVSRNRELSLREQWEKNKGFYDSTWDAVMDVEPSWYDRTAILNRADEYVVVHDVTGPRYSTEWFAHAMSDDFAVSGSSVRFPGREGVGVDIHLVKPREAKPEIIPVFKRLFAKELAEPKGKKPTQPRGPDQTVIRLKQPPSSEYLAIWHPRKTGQAKPIEVTNGKVMRVKSASGESMFVCEREAGEFRDGEFRLNGSIGHLITSGKKRCLGLLKGTEVSLRDCRLQIEGDARLQAMFEGGKLVGVQVWARDEVEARVDAAVPVRMVGEDGKTVAAGKSVAVRVGKGRTTFSCR